MPLLCVAHRGGLGAVPKIGWTGAWGSIATPIVDCTDIQSGTSDEMDLELVCSLRQRELRAHRCAAQAALARRHRLRCVRRLQDASNRRSRVVLNAIGHDRADAGYTAGEGLR